MTPKLFKAAEVCDVAQVQPYVLRSWEKEFPGIGVEKTPDGPRLYRQSDLDQVLTIKQLVFGEGLTLAGARRRLEGPGAAAVPAPVAQASQTSAPAATSRSTAPARAEQPALFEPPAAAGETRERLAQVKDGLRSILTLLSAEEGAPREGFTHASADATAHATVPPNEPRAVRTRKRATA